MNYRLVIKFLLLLFCASISADDSANIWSTYQGADIYPLPDKTDCRFPFEYLDNNYTDCTIDGDNGDIPWCSLTKHYKGLITYCQNFQNTTLQCLPSFTMPNGKVYKKCDYLSSGAIYKQCKTNHPSIRYRYCTDGTESLYKKSVQRRADCNRNYSSLAVDHTMCYGPNQYAIEVPLNATERQGVLDMHNKYRAAVSSNYMFKLHWDDELTKVAQAHSNLCVFEHDLAVNRGSPQYPWSIGQNIVMSSEISSTPASLIDMMLGSEKPYFKYGQGCYPDDNSCLHYTQAMLSDLTRVGCGHTHCVFPDRIERYLTCNYIQSQYEDNFMTPYAKNNINGAACPSKQKNGTCDCGDTICKYDKNELLDSGSCTCKTGPGKRSTDELDANAADVMGNERAVVSMKNGDLSSGRKPKGKRSIIGTFDMDKRADNADVATGLELNPVRSGIVSIKDSPLQPKSKRERKIIGIIDNVKRNFPVIHKYGHGHKHKNKDN